MMVTILRRLALSSSTVASSLPARALAVRGELVVAAAATSSVAFVDGTPAAAVISAGMILPPGIVAAYSYFAPIAGAGAAASPRFSSSPRLSKAAAGTEMYPVAHGCRRDACLGPAGVF